MQEERPAKSRKLRKNDVPTTTVEMAEPVEKPVEEPATKVRQLTVDAVPFDFLSEEEQNKFRAAAEQNRKENEARKKEEEANAKRARSLLGIFIGVGVGMYAAYLVKGKFFTPKLETVLNTAADIVESNTQ